MLQMFLLQMFQDTKQIEQVKPTEGGPDTTNFFLKHLSFPEVCIRHLGLIQMLQMFLLQMFQDTKQIEQVKPIGYCVIW
jgi:hypothetical protein